MDDHDKIAVIGAGSIGVAWTLVFARRHAVSLYDPDPDRRAQAFIELDAKLETLEHASLLDTPKNKLRQRIKNATTLENAIGDAAHV